MTMEFPAHKCSLHLTHNEHHSFYEKLADYFSAREGTDIFDGMSPEEKAECIRTDSLWTLQWYPDTPVGFYIVHASTLEKVLELANKIEIRFTKP